MYSVTISIGNEPAVCFWVSVAGVSFGGVLGGSTSPSKTQLAPPKPQLAPHIPQAPRSNSSWFSIIPIEIQMCHHFNITFSYILFFFFFFFFLWLRQGHSQGRLESDKKFIFKGSSALLELIFVPNFCWNTLLMWLQKTHKIAQNQKSFLEGGLTATPPPRTPPPPLLIRLASLGKASLPSPRKIWNDAPDLLPS